MRLSNHLSGHACRSGGQEESRRRREEEELLKLERQKHQEYLRRQQKEEEERRRQREEIEKATIMSEYKVHLDTKVSWRCGGHRVGSGNVAGSF